MNKFAISFCFLLLPAISFGGENLSKRLWDEVGVELKKPFLRNYIVVKQVRPGSYAETVGMQKGDRWVGKVTLWEKKMENQLQSDDSSYVVGEERFMLNGKPVLILARTASVKDLQVVSYVLLKAMNPQPSFKAPSFYCDLVRNSKKGDFTILGRGLIKAIGVAIKEVSFGEEHNFDFLKIEKVFPNSPAEKSGLKVNDFIVQADDSNTKDARDFINKIRSLEVGTNVKLLILRGELKPCKTKNGEGTCLENQKELTINVPVDLIVTEPYGDIQWEKSEK